MWVGAAWSAALLRRKLRSPVILLGSPVLDDRDFLAKNDLFFALDFPPIPDNVYLFLEQEAVFDYRYRFEHRNDEYVAFFSRARSFVYKALDGNALDGYLLDDVSHRDPLLFFMRFDADPYRPAGFFLYPRNGNFLLDDRDDLSFGLILVLRFG